MIFYRFRIHCATESEWKEVIKESTDAPPTLCPDDTSHTVTADSVSISEITDTDKQEVVTQMEKNDKTLRCFCAFASTDSNGIAKFAIQVPAPGRWIAYGDAEFENRAMGDYVSKIEIKDLDSLIPTQGQADYPLYPIIAYYDEKNFTGTPSANSIGTIKPGVSMTFKYGDTEVQPVGGYGFIPEGFYLCVELQKATATADEKCQISIDWAEPNA